MHQYQEKFFVCVNILGNKLILILLLANFKKRKQKSPTLPVEKKFEASGQDPTEQMQREAGGDAALGFDLDVASHISPRLSLQRRRKIKKVCVTTFFYHR